MKGIILAGGTGSRLDPLTRVTNKHLLPVYDRPMIYYPIQTLVEAGVTDIMIVSGKGHAGHFLELLKSGEAFGARFSYGVQEQAGGIAQALGLCEDFADNGKVVVILGDNILEDSLARAVKDFELQDRGGKIFLKEVANPQSFGIAEIAGDKIVAIEEKPKNPKTHLAVVGVYFYDRQVWDVIKTLKPSGRGELSNLTPTKQDRTKEIRYSVNADFTDEIARQYLRNLPSPEAVYQKLKQRDTAKFLL